MVSVDVDIDTLTNDQSERKLASNTETSIKRREPGIMKLAKVYNDLCKKMEDLARQQKAPRNITRPNPIDLHKLFALDVDDEIWQDAGLDEDEDDGRVPLWLEDSNIRNGIKHLLILDRCLEEEARLKKERCALQEWLCEEWLALQAAFTKNGSLPFAWMTDAIGANTYADVNEDIIYQLRL
jgi:hypothetical protein